MRLGVASHIGILRHGKEVEFPKFSRRTDPGLALFVISTLS